MTIDLICVGNLKEKFSKDAQNEYLKRLSAFAKVNIIEVKEQNALNNPASIILKEGEEILKNLSGYAIACDINSKEYSSEEFSKKLEALMQTNSHITFVIGGSYGLSNEVKNVCKEKMSFGKMTFPHNLFRIMLLEQIYRAFTIISGKTYHK